MFSVKDISEYDVAFIAAFATHYDMTEVKAYRYLNRYSACLVAYNKAFYKSCLKAVFRDYQRFYLGYPFHCISVASRKAWPQVQQTLNVTAACCGNNLSNRHLALEDAEAYVAVALENL